MPLEHDYDESVMNETIPNINIPALYPAIITPLNSSRCSKELFTNLENLMLEEKQIEENRIHLLKKKQQHIGEQVERTLAEKERKIREIQQEQKKRLYSECTFKPKTIIKGQRRSLNEFLHQQEEFTKKVNQKRITLKQNLEAEKNKDTFHPKTNSKLKGSEVRKDKECTVFERLYALKDKQNDQFNEQEKTEPVFHPKITQKSKKMTRNAPIDNLLYSDALRRQQKARELQQSGNCFQSNKYQKSINVINQKYVAQKFIKEYFIVIKDLGISTSLQAKIEYMLFNQILKEMYFVQVEENNQNSYERTLIHQAYQILQKYQVNARNICVFLLAIIGVYHINPVNFSEAQEQSEPEKQLSLDEVQGRKLQKYFDLFKRNRLFSQSNRRFVDNQRVDYSYHPKINKVSEQMAERHRSQMLEQANKLLTAYPQLDYNVPEDGVITLTDLLVLNNLAKDIRVQQQKEQGQKKQMEQCTFKPAIFNSVSQTLNNSKISSVEGSLGQKKSLELYNFHRNMQSKKDSLKASRQTEDDKFKECTFSPNLVHPKVTTDTSKFKTKDVQQALFRMKKGREQSQEKKQFLQRGQKQPKKQKQYYSMKQKIELGQQKTEEQLPTLVLDINLGEKKDRLILYHGDEDRLQYVAHEFAKKNNLDIQNQKKLCELLKIELESILMKIEEDEQSDQNIEQ